MAYQGIKARRATLQAEIERFDAGDGGDMGDVGSLVKKSPSEYRADLGRRRDQLDRLIRAGGNR
jgi:hypothetical protein